MLRFVPRDTAAPCFERPDGMSDMLHELLCARGVRSRAEADAFLRPCADQLRDPFLLSDMDRAVAVISKAKERGARICVYGDYDVDGVCASAILYLYLKGEGIDCEVYIPSRHEEGYGLNETAVREIAARCDLLVTVDNGITAAGLIALAQELGLECLVTDHHRIEGELPPCPTVNPLLNDYPFGFLCGAGVAFKLVWALGGREKALEYVDLAALATVADVVPLRDENRAIVSLGLARINATPRVGIRMLMEVSSVKDGALTSQDIAFRLGPRLNAGGRLGSAMRSFELLTTQEEFEATALADELEQENRARRETEEKMRLEAVSQIGGMDLSAHGIIIVSGENWNVGVIGLMAGRLKEKYNYPVIALAEQDGVLTGSCRSIEGADIFRALQSVADKLERFGGHAMAAGLALKKEDLADVRRALDQWMRDNVPPEAYTPCVEYDLEMPLASLNEREIEELKLLEPTGAGNPEPRFYARVGIEDSRAVGKDGAHLQLFAAQDGTRRKGICFREGALAGKLGDAAEIAFSPRLNVWNNRASVELQIDAVRPLGQESYLSALDPGPLLRGSIAEYYYEKKAEPARAVGRMTRGALHEALTRSPFGTWILCADSKTALRILKEAGQAAPDLSVGALPGDPRCFNTLILWPQKAGYVPRGVKRLVLAGAPALKDVFGDAPLYELDGSPLPPLEPPDVDALREVFKAARRVKRKGARLKDLEQLSQALSSESGLDATACLKSALILEDSGLFAFESDPFSFDVVEGVRAAPTQSRLYEIFSQSAKHPYQGVGKV